MSAKRIYLILLVMTILMLAVTTALLRHH